MIRIKNDDELQLEPQGRDASDPNVPNAEALPEDTTEEVDKENGENQIKGEGYRQSGTTTSR